MPFRFDIPIWKIKGAAPQRPGIDERLHGDTIRGMVALKTTAKVDRSRTLAVLLPQCGVEAGEYEVLVVLAGAEEVVRRAPLTFSSHRLGSQESHTWSRSEIYDDDGR